MRKLVFIGTLLASVVSAPTMAIGQDLNLTPSMSNFSYDYFDVRVGLSPVTYGGGVSMSIHPNAHVRAEVDTEFDKDWDFTGAVGFHAPVNDWADIYGELALRNVKKRDVYKDGEFGIEVAIGVRQWLTPQLEVGGEIGHVSIKEEDEKVFGSVTGRFHATELFSIGAQFRFNEIYDDQLVLSTRFKF
ncbi:hypothetical protein CS022_01585 [Veronia nyctiphanis]|uniref:Outer membrane protein beta-barrel domain-containing protein n=1 Tax=Veronia nyctiphanis TaxID=1278244 RepID=A0A4Q0Z0G0_9GAMM|nr:outer membrane beta-barrel protein [Veronia nyctiphanis]RXJ74909.1 hypothetical protein CS022_01585 [Veronia nyctiphanis]